MQLIWLIFFTIASLHVFCSRKFQRFQFVLAQRNCIDLLVSMSSGLIYCAYMLTSSSVQLLCLPVLCSNYSLLDVVVGTDIQASQFALSCCVIFIFGNLISLCIACVDFTFVVCMLLLVQQFYSARRCQDGHSRSIECITQCITCRGGWSVQLANICICCALSTYARY